MSSKNQIGRVGFHYRPKARAGKIGFLMGLLNIQDPREALNHCVDEVYRAYAEALEKAKEKEQADVKGTTAIINK